ncbi:MAG: YWFCY domain-containing protein [Bacteroides sp.]|nr:YWFCY domain-containing protein [Bacteroides sp.]MCM1531473.1 YWFCY domain-containing protein [Ruminococcus flavefaciens]MCM1554365.1 YWFCY domain-containing protein [Bacteroides sp.]
MQDTTDDKTIEKFMGVLRIIAVVFLFIHLYYFMFPVWKEAGVYHAFVNKILMRLQTLYGMYSTTWPTKIICFLFLAVGCMGVSGKKKEDLSWQDVMWRIVVGFLLFFGSGVFFVHGYRLSHTLYIIYGVVTSTGFIFLMWGGILASRLIRVNLMEDQFNDENESFMQERKRKTNKNSINIPTQFYYRGKWRNGWINVVNPFRASMVLGTPGSGKSFAVINNYIKQCIEKGFAMYIYDYKFPALSDIAINHYRLHSKGYKINPSVYVLNFDDPRRSHRCNPINPKLMTDITDAYEAAYTIMLNLNKTWIQKQGEFFVESPITLVSAIIWFLKIYKGGRYCTFPHVIQLLNVPYTELFPILMSYGELEAYLSPFVGAWKGNAQDQLQGQLASAQIPLSRMSSPQLYWVMSGDDFTLDINNPKEPKILCVGNNPDRQAIYGAALGLYNGRIAKLINKQGQLKSCVLIDELPTMYFKGLDNLVNTARSNKVAVCLGFQDFSQLNRDYGDKESKVIQNTVGNLFSGQVVGETADLISKRFGKVLQRRQSLSINKHDTSVSISTQLDSLIPASKISNLSQGMFVGTVVDDFGQKIKQKMFNAAIVVDVEKVKAEEKQYQKIPVITDFTDENGEDKMQETIMANYHRIVAETKQLVKDEIARIEADPDLCHLLEDAE